jgi:hypothetical protein
LEFLQNSESIALKASDLQWKIRFSVADFPVPAHSCAMLTLTASFAVKSTLADF